MLTTYQGHWRLEYMFPMNKNRKREEEDGGSIEPHHMYIVVDVTHGGSGDLHRGDPTRLKRIKFDSVSDLELLLG